MSWTRPPSSPAEVLAREREAWLWDDDVAERVIPAGLGPVIQQLRGMAIERAKKELEGDMLIRFSPNGAKY